MTRHRLLGLIAAVVALLALLLGVNALVVGAETKSAHADVGRIIDLPHGDDLQVREDGPRSAPAIVLLHGFASSLHWWDAITPALASRYHVIRFDLLGNGGSAKPSGGYSMEHEAQLVEEALTKLGIHRALIVGHSMGGLVATALATRDRSLAAGIVLIDSPVDNHAGSLPFLARLGFVPLIGPATRTLASNGMVEQGLKEAFAPGFKVPHQFISDFWKMTYTSYVSTDDESHKYLAHEPLDARLRTLGLPVLVLYGTRDKLVSPSSERDYTEVPDTKVVAIAGAGHSPMVEKPYATSRLILPFAARTLRAGRPNRQKSALSDGGQPR
jgi:pimeloyl-ACP methyl ester carboxylesterase